MKEDEGSVTLGDRENRTVASCLSLRLMSSESASNLLAARNVGASYRGENARVARGGTQGYVCGVLWLRWSLACNSANSAVASSTEVCCCSSSRFRLERAL